MFRPAAGYAADLAGVGMAVMLFRSRHPFADGFSSDCWRAPRWRRCLEFSFSNVVSVLLLLGLLTAADIFPGVARRIARAVEVGWAWVGAGALDGAPQRGAGFRLEKRAGFLAGLQNRPISG